MMLIVSLPPDISSSVAIWRASCGRPGRDGRLGGGWGDDVEIGIVWESLMLVNPDASALVMETTRAIAEGVWWSGDIDREVGYFDGIADVRPQRVTAAQFAGVDPDVLAKVIERLLKVAHESVVLRTVGEEECCSWLCHVVGI